MINTSVFHFQQPSSNFVMVGDCCCLGATHRAIFGTVIAREGHRANLGNGTTLGQRFQNFVASEVVGLDYCNNRKTAACGGNQTQTAKRGINNSDEFGELTCWAYT
eukprot:c18475_g1_i2.p2 GENE.c18475_g1_i2~~c18475_g1_i2.p2  ORF type:complete len:106 (-),score=14.61 c18475_g1_i2:486-803(-)